MSKLVLAVMVAVSAVAQTNAPDTVRKVVDVKHLSGDRASRAVNLLKAYMHPVGSVHFDQALKAAVLIGPDKVVAGAEALLAKFDSPTGLRPDRQVQLRIHLVEALPEAAAASAMPAEIAPAVEQMKKTFTYKGYRHVDTVTALGKEGIMGAGTIYSPDESIANRITYNFRVQALDVLEDGKTVALKNFTFQMKVPYTMRLSQSSSQTQVAETNINTDLTIQTGQKLVVGKLASSTPQNAMFVILTAEVQ
jgi:hypothetical protein